MSPCICQGGARVTCPVHGLSTAKMLDETEERHMSAGYAQPRGAAKVTVLPLWRAMLALKLEELAESAGRDGYAIGGTEGALAYSVERDLRKLSEQLRTMEATS